MARGCGRISLFWLEDGENAGHKHEALVSESVPVVRRKDRLPIKDVRHRRNERGFGGYGLFLNENGLTMLRQYDDNNDNGLARLVRLRLRSARLGCPVYGQGKPEYNHNEWSSRHGKDLSRSVVNEVNCLFEKNAGYPGV